MPSVSKQQQKFMGIVHAIQKGDMKPSDASPEAQQAAKDMKPSDVTDFASTKHKGLPKKVKQEILKRLKEYAMTLPGHHVKSPSPNVPLRNDRDMDLEEGKGRDLATTLIRNARNSMRKLSDNDVEEFRKEIALAFDLKEGRIPTNFNVGTTQDYHTKLATTPREDYDETNFNPEDSGQPDLDESFNELEHLKLLNLAMKAMPGSPKQKEIIKKLNQVRIAGGMKPIKEVGLGDWHFKAIQKMYQKAGAFTRKKIAAVITKNPNSSWDKIERELRGSDYDEVTYYTDKLGLGEVVNHMNEYASKQTLSYIIPSEEEIEKMNEGLMIRRAVDIAQELLPKDTWSRFASDGKKNAEFVKNVVRDLTQSLNRFYKSHNINVRLKEGEEDGSEIDMVLGVLSILRQVEDKENRKRMALDIIQKFKEDDVEFDYKEFLELMKEYKN